MKPKNDESQFLTQGQIAELQAKASPRMEAERKLADSGVFLGHQGLRGLAESDAFWDKQPYGTRLYYGDGMMDYLHRSVLQTAVEILDVPASDIHVDNSRAHGQTTTGTCHVCKDGQLKGWLAKYCAMCAPITTGYDELKAELEKTRLHLDASEALCRAWVSKNDELQKELIAALDKLVKAENENDAVKKELAEAKADNILLREQEHALILEVDEFKSEIATLRVEWKTSRDSEYLALRNNEKSRDEIARLRGLCAKQQDCLWGIANWRVGARAYDEDMRNPARDFDSEEEIELIENCAKMCLDSCDDLAGKGEI